MSNITGNMFYIIHDVLLCQTFPEMTKGTIRNSGTKQSKAMGHPALKRQDRLGKDPFAGFGTVVEDITESGYTKNQPILLGAF